MRTRRRTARIALLANPMIRLAFPTERIDLQQIGMVSNVPIFAGKSGIGR